MKRLVVCCAIALGCSSASADATFTESVPDRATFAPVAQALVHHCGTLDCHGTPSRNLRLFGNESLRFRAGDLPLTPPCTTPREVDEDFASVVGLEPTETSAVVTGDASPESLTLVRKPRSVERHVGHQLMSPGDDLDLCITSWLTGSSRADACARTGPPTIPPPAPGETPACEPGP